MDQETIDQYKTLQELIQAEVCRVVAIVKNYNRGLNDFKLVDFGFWKEEIYVTFQCKYDEDQISEDFPASLLYSSDEIAADYFLTKQHQSALEEDAVRAKLKNTLRAQELKMYESLKKKFEGEDKL